MVLVALFAPWLGTVDPEAISPRQRLKFPSAAAWFGTDMFGRDVYSRTLYGARVSLVVGGAVAVLSLAIGMLIGLVSGYSRAVDAIVTRVMDGLMAVPDVLLAIALMALTRASLQNVVLAITITQIPRVVRLVRGITLSLREQPFVEAAITSGTGVFGILFRHILPNSIAPAARAGHLHLRLGDDHRGHPQLHRRRHAAGRAELGQHHGRGPQPVPGGLLRHPVSRRLPVAHRAGREPRRRRPARRAGPTAVEAPVSAVMSSTPLPIATAAVAQPLLAVEGLSTRFFMRDGVVAAVDGVTFSVGAGETLAIVGESGSGKSVTAMSILRLIPRAVGRTVAGSVRLHGQDLLKLSEPEMRRVRGNRISMVFQEPMTSLNPVLRIGRQIAEILRLHARMDGPQAMERSVELLAMVHLSEPARRARQYPHELSGGMRQRVMIAMALACDPELLIADEPTTALDVTIQAQILDLMRELQQRSRAAILLITHDLGVVAEMAQRVAVMYAGRIVEEAPVGALFAAPLHPYTKGLLGSMPHLGSSLVAGASARLREIPGTIPLLNQPIVGCAYAPRCPLAVERCRREAPALEAHAPGRRSACFEWDRVTAA